MSFLSTASRASSKTSTKSSSKSPASSSGSRGGGSNTQPRSSVDALKYGNPNLDQFGMIIGDSGAPKSTDQSHPNAFVQSWKKPTPAKPTPTPPKPPTPPTSTPTPVVPTPSVPKPGDNPTPSNPIPPQIPVVVDKTSNAANPAYAPTLADGSIVFTGLRGSRDWRNPALSTRFNLLGPRRGGRPTLIPGARSET